MVLVLTLNADFFHGERCQQRANLRGNRTIQATDDNSVTDLKQTIDENYVDGRALAHNNLDLEYGTLKDILFLQLQPVWSLTHLDQHSH